MKAREFVNLWGAGDLVRPPAEAVASAALDQKSAEFLLDAGLPRRAGLELDFSSLEEGLPHLADLLRSRGMQVEEEWAGYCVLGQDNAGYICVVPERDDAIVAVWPRERLERFVNTGIQHLAECLLAYRNISKGSSHLDDASYAEDLRRYIVGVDPAALQDAESWWSVVIEQASYGDL
jgi:hypothetical protein